MQKRTIILATAILTLTILVSGIVVVKQQEKEVKRNIQEQQLTTSTNNLNERTGDEDVEVLTSDIDTSNWKTYRNDEYGFEFKYPEEWEVKEFKTGEPKRDPIASILMLEFFSDDMPILFVAIDDRYNITTRNNWDVSTIMVGNIQTKKIVNEVRITSFLELDDLLLTFSGVLNSPAQSIEEDVFDSILLTYNNLN